MNLYKINEAETPLQKMGCLVVFGSLLFSVAALSCFPLGSALRYYMYGLALFSIIYLALSYSVIDWRCYGKSFLYCCIPFFPLLFVYVVIKTYHAIYWTDDGIFFPQFVLLIVASSVVFGVITQQNTRVSKRLFFLSCAIAAFLYFSDVVITAFIHRVSVWAVKGLVHPYSTTYARCITLISGLSFLGFFLLPISEKKIRLFCLIASLFGFCSSIGFIGVRSVVLAPLIALIIGYCVSPLRTRTKVLTSILFSLLVAIVVVQSPIVSKMRLAYDEATNVISTDAVAKTLDNINNLDQSPEEIRAQKYLNTSVGARFAVWGIAERALKNHLWLGTSKGRPHNFVNTRKLFKFSHDYLKHFHSDYIQASVVGGMILLIALLVTQLWLFIRSLKDPITIYMTLSMIIYGLIDYGFFDRRVLVCYVGASLIIWSWHYPKSQEQTGT